MKNKKIMFISIGAAALVVIGIVVGVVLLTNKSEPSLEGGGSLIGITGSKAPKVTVPSLVGTVHSTAEKSLTDLGFSVVTREEFNDNYAKGTVVAQSVTGGRSANKGAEIQLVISKGPDIVTVPNVVGKTKSETEDEFYRSGLVAKFELKCSDTVPEGKIISQNTGSGTTLKRGETVTVCLSAGVSNTFGTTPSNALNFGTVTSQGDWVYYVNKNYNWYIYKMRHDGSEKQIAVRHEAVNVNVVGDWIYFTDENAASKGIYRARLDGTEITKLITGTYYWVFVTKDYIFYSESAHSGKLYRANLNGSNATVICSDNCQEINYENGWFYYMSGNNICKIREDGTQKQIVKAGVTGTDFRVENGNAIFDENITYSISTIKTDGSLYRRDMLDRESYSIINMNNGWVYFEGFKSNIGQGYSPYVALYKMRPDLSEKTLISDKCSLGNVNVYLCSVGDWLYFPNAEDNSRLYRVKADGSVIEKVYM